MPPLIGKMQLKNPLIDGLLVGSINSSIQKVREVEIWCNTLS